MIKKLFLNINMSKTSCSHFTVAAHFKSSCANKSLSVKIKLNWSKGVYESGAFAPFMTKSPGFQENIHKKSI